MAEESDSDFKEPLKKVGKFSSFIKQYPNDALKVYNNEDNFIGSGSYGEVRKYQFKDKVVAVKRFVFKEDDETTTKTWNMILHETNILCRFHHENVVEILGITQWPSAVGIILEYIDGGNLQGLLSDDNQNDLSWNARLQIATGITSGLEYIHNYGEKKIFCHGDLKPENVLLTKSLQVKLADFGSAAFYRATGASATTIDNDPGTQFTLIYVAPEFLEDNSRKRNPAMDMYSFGMVSYELISGKAPYSDCSMPHFLLGLIAARIKPTMKLIDTVESKIESDDEYSAFNLLKSLMERCWNNEPDSRPSSKTVKMELSSYLVERKPRSSSSQIHNIHGEREVAVKEADNVGDGSPEQASKSKLGETSFGLLKDRVPTATRAFPSLTSYFALSSVDLAKILLPQPKDEKLLIKCNLAHQLNDAKEIRRVADSLPDDILLSGSILPGDVTNLCKILKASDTSRFLSVGTYNQDATFIGEGFDILLRNIRTSGHQIIKLHVKNQDLKLSKIQHLLDKLEELGLSQCKLTIDDVGTIFNVLKKRQKPIKYLCLVDTDTGSAVIKSFSQCPQNIEMLVLQACNVTEQDTKQLAESVGQLQKPMEMLDLSANDLCHNNFSLLAQSVKFIKVLSLTGCKLNNFHVEVLALEVEKLEQPMEWLNLSDNNIGRAGLNCLARCIHNIKTLGIYRCRFSQHDLDEFLSAVKDLDRPMKFLNLSVNDVGRHGMELLKNCVHNIRILILFNTRLIGEDVAELAKSIGTLKEPMEFLELGGNSLKDGETIEIMECLHKIKILSLRKCRLTNADIEQVRQNNIEIGEKCKIYGLDDQ